MKAKTILIEDSFDAVKFMRQQRDRISKDIAGMSFSEIRNYFSQKTSSKELAKRSSRVVK